MQQLIYLDHAATTPIDPAVIGCMLPYLENDFYNPSAIYLAAKGVRRDVEQARSQIAQVLGARPAEVIFTAGGTESDNLAIRGIMQRYSDANVIVSTIEHDAVLEPAAHYDVRYAPVSAQGVMDVSKLMSMVDSQTVLISVMYANNEIGTIQPIRKISQSVAEIRRQRRIDGNPLPLYVHTDACQAALYLDLHVGRLGVDLLTLNASKIYGPKQIGILYAAAGVELEPILYGGGQERNIRSGTENVAAIMGLAEALRLAEKRKNGEVKRLQLLQKLFMDLLEESVPGVVVNGSRKYRLPNNVHVTFPGVDNERLMMQLDELGVQVAIGSACNASSEEPSHVLKAIGCSDADARASLRMTMGRSTDEAAVRRTVELLATLT